MKVSSRDWGVTLEVIVQPGASRTELIGERDGAIKLRIAAPALAGRANQECIRWLAKWLGVRRSALTIITGVTYRRKTIHVKGITPPALLETLNREGSTRLQLLNEQQTTNTK